MKKIIACAAVLLFLNGFVEAQIIRAPVQRDAIREINVPAKTVAFRLSDFQGLKLAPTDPGSAKGTDLNLAVKEFDLANNTKGSTFVAPEDGVYHFDLRLNLMPVITDYNTYLRYALMLHKGSDTVIERAVLMNPQTPFSPHHTLSISTTVLLNKGEVVYGSYRGDGEANATGIGATASFSGFLVAPITASSPASNQIR